MGAIKALLVFSIILSVANGDPFGELLDHMKRDRNLILQKNENFDHESNLVNKNLESKIQNKLLYKAAVPSYVSDFIKIIKDAGPDTAPSVIDRVFEGVQSKDCIGHLLEWSWRMTKGIEDVFTDEEKWVLQMIDAWGKLPPEGLLSGHINALGDFHECVQIKVKDLVVRNEQEEYQDISQSFEGRYCNSYLLDYGSAMALANRTPVQTPESQGIGTNEAVSMRELIEMILTQKLSIPMMMPSIGVCMPNSCSQLDVQNILVNIFNITYPWLTDDELPSTMLLWPVTASCNVEKKPDFDAAAISVIVILSILFILGLSAGIVDCWFDRANGNHKPPKSTAFKYFMAFSMYTNTKKWLSTRKSADDLGCLHGIRFLSTAWVVLAHGFMAFATQPQWNMVDLKNSWKDWTILVIINGTFSVDTFFVMSGMLATYNILKMLDRTKGKMNLPMFYIHRYIRLTPTYAILVGIGATLLTYTGNGPFWSAIEGAEKNCRDNWWTNILYINNLYRTDKMCNGESWYLANDMQFYILSPLIVYPIWKWEVIGLVLLTIYTALSCISPVLIVRYTTAPPAMIMTAELTGDFIEIYQRPWARIQTFIVGIWLGYILHKTKGKKINLSPFVAAAGWGVSTGLALSVLFGIYPWFNPKNEIPDVEGYFYAGLSRFTYGVAVSWVIFACVKGYGGLVNSFLSWKVFMPLGRLCFCVYLTSLHLQQIFHARIAQTMRFDSYFVTNLFFAHMVMSCMVGFICTLLFESPFIVLHKLLFEGNGPKPQPKPMFVNGNGTLKGDDSVLTRVDISKNHG